MGLNKSKGNMYPWVTHTWNVIKGICPHGCIYCYMHGIVKRRLYFDKSELKTNLGCHNFIFVGSSCDMWAENIPQEWIAMVLKYCRDNDCYNQYLFQSKNPMRFARLIFPDGSLFGTTIESNRHYPQISQAPAPVLRFEYMSRLLYRRMVSIEPILDFDLKDMVFWMEKIAPEFISIGADSKGHNLPEPSYDKVQALIEALQKFTEVKIKDNLKRLTS